MIFSLTIGMLSQIFGCSTDQLESLLVILVSIDLIYILAVELFFRDTGKLVDTDNEFAMSHVESAVFLSFEKIDPGGLF